MVDYININLWGRQIGAAVWNERTGFATFEYAPEFVAHSGLEVAPLTMPLAEGRTYSFGELNRTTFKGLPGLLADSLPDKFGNAVINSWLACQGRLPDSYNSLERLLYLGSRCMGALTFEPAEAVTIPMTDRLEIDELVAAAGEILSDRKRFATDLCDKTAGISQILQVGTSAGGARAKVVIAYNETTGEVRSGQTDAPIGFSHWLLKLDGVKDGALGDPAHFGRIEYAYYKMATAAGIDMTECRLLEENDRAHFMTRRFDRINGNDRVHTQTLCGIAHFDYNLPQAYSYEQLFQVMRALHLPYTAAEQMFRRMVFNVVARNQDDHTKNTTFLMNQQGEWSLAPAYDMTFAYNPSGDYTAHHQMTINGKSDRFTKNDLFAVAKQIHVKRPQMILEEVVDSVSQWSSIAKACGVSASQISAIAASHLLKIM